MSPKLKPLLLPQLVEERRRRESMSEPESELSSSFYSQSSTDAPSPVTPTFSTRGHLRYPSSTSSAESSFTSSALSESPSSPALAASKTGKRSLPDVQEEPQEREEDFDMLEDADESYDCLCNTHDCLHRDATMAQSSVQFSIPQEFDYDLAEGFFSDGEFTLNPRIKKRRANESPLNELATRFETKFPAFSRRWRMRKGSSAASIASEQENAGSREPSSRSSSVSNPGRRRLDGAMEPNLPPTPARSISEDIEKLTPASSIDIDKANRASEEEGEERLATTPLLPPLMMDTSGDSTLMQSPLQSPAVAEPNEPVSGTITPIEAVATPQLHGVTTPPLSSKASISSFHHSTANRPPHLIPSSEIPAIMIADPHDEWANKLGHANFNVYPEPYLPETFDMEACRQLRTDWDTARCNYMRHLVRTGEHYGTTSKTYKLTNVKWASIDALWRENNDLVITRTVENSSEAFATLKHTTLGDPSAVNIMTKIPSLNDIRSGGKFPQLGDEDIVGPMVQAAARLQRSPSKKAKLFRFLAEKFPVGLGKP